MWGPIYRRWVLCAFSGCKLLADRKVGMWHLCDTHARGVEKVVKA